MVKKNKIRSDNRKDIIHDLEFSLMILNMLKHFNLGYLYYKKGVFDNIDFHLNEKKLIDSVSYNRNKTFYNDTKLYIKNLYLFVDHLTNLSAEYTKKIDKDISFEPNFKNIGPTMNIFFMFQYSFKDVEEFECIIAKLDMNKMQIAKYMIIKYGRMVFAYDIDFYSVNYKMILNSIFDICYTECIKCKNILDKIHKINQCTKCNKLCCSFCNKRCPYCSR